VVIGLHLALVIAQAVTAGQFLSGADGSVVAHERFGQIVAAIGLLQIPLAAIRRNSVAFLITCVVIFLAEALQISTGYGRFLGVHIPLGLLIAGGLAAQLVWLFR
jgi:hypothetical protein